MPKDTKKSSPVEGKPKAIKKTKAKKDPNAPKKALSSFMFFSSLNRARIKEENPDASFGDLGKLLGSEWKEISEEDKEKYTKLAEEDKERYAQAMVEYEKTKE